ncbi:MAG TPA: ABC transporter permease [Longimicrobiales bacterium]|nr:ABC transporter permease [Longimicrobiales bacterium]
MTLLNDLRFTFRSLSRRPGFTVVAVGTLALGVGATAAIFTVANAVVLRSLPYPDAHELAVVWEDSRSDPSPDPGGRVSRPNFRDLQAEAVSFETIAQYTNSNLTLTGLGAAEVVPGGTVSAELFSVFGAEPILGRTFTAEETRHEGPDAVVVSEGFWRSRLGGEPDVLGTSLVISGAPHPIVGIAPAGFAFPADAQLWVPIQNDDDGCGRGCSLFAAVGRLGPGGTMDGAASELATLASRLEAEYPDSNADLELRAIPLRDLVVGDVEEALWLLLGAVGMVLLIACANVANLILVRGGSRRTELAVRTALGGSRGVILRQLMTENAVLALAGGAGGLMLAWWGVSALVRLAPTHLPRMGEVALDGTTVLFALGVVALTVLIFGLAPAARLSKDGVAESMRQGSRGGVGELHARRTRSAVLVVEVALSVVLLLGAGLMVRSLARMQAVDLGIDARDASLFRLSLPSARYAGPDERVAFMDRLEERLASIPGVERVASTVAPPFGPVNLTGTFSRPDLPEPEPGEGPSAAYRVLDPDALEVLGIELVRGRPFRESDRQGARPVAMINRAAAERFWAGEDPVGKTMDLNISVGYPESEPRTIIGITENFHSTITRAPGPEMYVPYAQTAASFPHVIMQTAGGTPGGALAAAREALASLDPELPMITPTRLEELVAEQMAAPRFYLLLLGLFAVMAAALAAVGIYGVVAFLVVQRTREIGVRMALGAPIRQVVRMVIWQGLAPALLGMAIGLTVAMALGEVLSGILYRVEPTDPVASVGAATLLLAIVVASTLVPARRASRIPPADALRAE